MASPHEGVEHVRNAVRAGLVDVGQRLAKGETRVDRAAARNGVGRFGVAEPPALLLLLPFQRPSPSLSKPVGASSSHT